MTRRSDHLFEMLDVTTADRMLSGAVAPSDAPPGYERVVQLLSALADPVSVDARDLAWPAAPSRPRAARNRRRLLVTCLVAATIFAGAAGAAFASVLPNAISGPIAHLIHRIAHPASPTPDRRAPTRAAPLSGQQVGGRGRPSLRPGSGGSAGRGNAPTGAGTGAPDSTGGVGAGQTPPQAERQPRANVPTSATTLAQPPAAAPAARAPTSVR